MKIAKNGWMTLHRQLSNDPVKQLITYWRCESFEATQAIVPLKAHYKQMHSALLKADGSSVLSYEFPILGASFACVRRLENRGLHVKRGNTKLKSNLHIFN